MAKKSPKKRILKKPATTRQLASKPAKQPKARRLSSAASKIKSPLKSAATIGRKEYYLPMPSGKVGQFLNKRRYFIPKYFKDSWGEMRQVVWPNRKQTFQLTLAVIIFSVFFGVIVALADFGLDKLFERLIIK